MLTSPGIDAVTPKFTRLHQAASDGKVKAIQAILRKSPDSVYAVDEHGLTPLHYAALNGHLNAVKALSPDGEAIDLLDNQGLLPITYVDSEKYPEIIDYFLEKYSYPVGTTDIHLAAASGNVSEIKRLLAAAPEKLELTNNTLFTPLMYAILNNQKQAAEYLVRAGANVDALDSMQNDLVSLATDQPILGYAKRLCGLTPNTIHQLRNAFQSMIENEMLAAKQQNKRLLIILGETHFLYKILQVEEMMYRVAQNLGIDTLLVEERPEVEDMYTSDAKAKQLGMNVVAIDHPSLEATIDQRNAHMTQAIFDADQNAVIRIGSDHLQGILEMPGSANIASVFHQRFHIVPFNLSTINNTFAPLTDEATFAFNEEHAILVRQQGLSNPDAVLRRWNPPQQAAGIFNLAYRFAAQYLPSFATSSAPQVDHKRSLDDEEEHESSPGKRYRKK